MFEIIWYETWILFLALNKFHFLWVLGKSLRNNVPHTILSSPSPWYFFQYHQRISHTTHVSHASTLPTLVRYPVKSETYCSMTLHFVAEKSVKDSATHKTKIKFWTENALPTHLKKSHKYKTVTQDINS